MDQRVIRSLKAQYRTKVAQKMIDAINNDKLLETTSINEVMKMLVPAWDDVSTTTVQKCFKKAGFSDDDSDDPFSTSKHSIEQLQWFLTVSHVIIFLH